MTFLLHQFILCDLPEFRITVVYQIINISIIRNSPETEEKKQTLDKTLHKSLDKTLHKSLDKTLHKSLDKTIRKS